jgi:hypothetical protein
VIRRLLLVCALALGVLTAGATTASAATASVPVANGNILCLYNIQPLEVGLCLAL